jgi:hypothetical protein
MEIIKLEERLRRIEYIGSLYGLPIYIGKPLKGLNSEIWAYTETKERVLKLLKEKG